MNDKMIYPTLDKDEIQIAEHTDDALYVASENADKSDNGAVLKGGAETIDMSSWE